jgi:hypothetical protein
LSGAGGEVFDAFAIHDLYSGLETADDELALKIEANFIQIKHGFEGVNKNVLELLWRSWVAIMLKRKFLASVRYEGGI